MDNIFVHMGKTIRDSFLMVALFALMVTALPLVLGDTSSTSQWIANVFLVYLLHRTVLFGPLPLFGKRALQADGSPMPKEHVWRFVLVSLLFGTVCLAPTILVVLNVEFEEPNSREKMMLVVPTVFGITFWLVATLFGTLLPAAAAGRKFSVVAALRASWATWYRVAGQLLLFSGLYWLLVFVALIWLGRIVDSDSLSPTTAFLFEWITSIVFTQMSVMTVVILCRAYISDYPQDPQDGVYKGPMRDRDGFERSEDGTIIIRG